jgi:hypothetical protein
MVFIKVSDHPIESSYSQKVIPGKGHDLEQDGQVPFQISINSEEGLN